MIGSAVAAIFVRDLTEQQFSARPRASSAQPQTVRSAAVPRPGSLRRGRQESMRPTATRLGRALHRLAHVRG
jgi:hypothetical protein